MKKAAAANKNPTQPAKKETPWYFDTWWWFIGLAVAGIIIYAGYGEFLLIAALLVLLIWIITLKSPQTIESKAIKNPTTIKNVKSVEGVVGGAVAGTFSGIIVGLILIFIGGILSATIVGAIIGIPMILAGFTSFAVGPFAGIKMGSNLVHQSCPYCQNGLSFQSTDKAITCKYCKKRLLIKEQALVLVK